MRRLFKAIAAFFALIALGSCGGHMGRQTAIPPAVDGVLDLRTFDFEKRGAVKLDGLWEFHWKTYLVSEQAGMSGEGKGFISVPGSWNDYKVHGRKIGSAGYGTYRLRVLMPPRAPVLALRLLNFGTAFSLYVNGEKTASAGVTGKDSTTTKPWYKPQICRITQDYTRELTICVEVANFHEFHGGIWDSIFLGPEGDIRTLREERQYLEFLIFGAIFFMGLYHLGLYSLKPKIISPLYFSIICFLFAARIVFTHERFILEIFPGINWVVFHKIEYLTFTVTVAVFVSFIRIIFPDEFHKKWHAIITGTSCLYSGFIVVTPPMVYASTVSGFQIATIGFAVYILYVHVLAIMHKRNGALAIFAGFLVLFATVINDILHQNQLIHTSFLSPLGLFIFLFSQAFVISMRFSRAFDSIEMLKEAAETANQAKDQFIANMSHELRTPLNGVIGMTELIRGTCLDETQKEYIHIIRSSSSLLLTLVNDILDLSKLESGQIYVEQLSFNLNDVVESVHSILRDRAKEKEIEFSYHIPPDMEPNVIGDADRLKQVLLNIAGNAIKFTDKGSVSIHLETDDTGEAVEVVTFRICDTGIGIEPDKIGRLFKPFSQADASMSRKYGGSGLGLAISKQLVERMGGNIGVISRKGKGSEFRFTLPFPLCPGTPENEEPSDEPNNPEVTTMNRNRSSRVLIVEDNAANRRLAEILVKKLGHETQSACDGRQAVDLLCETSFDLILMDVQMPHMDGFEATRLIRDPESRVMDHDVPIIAMTAHAMQGDMEKCFEAGMDAYLTKPIKPEHLKEIVFRQLEKEKHLKTS
jgi:signal transduction histidine kinase/CheY-like chemotaxis protein